MRWFASAKKATGHFLDRKKYRLHEVSNSGCSKSMVLPSLLISGYQYYSTMPMVNGTLYRSLKNGNKHENDDNYNNNNNNNKANNYKKVDLEITSIETIKPISPTPHHLRNFNLSIIDQCYHDCYTPLSLFFPNNDKVSANDIVKHLKKTLSEILTPFYPLAGEIKDNLHIECNDKGVYFIEARVNQTLKEFLLHPDDEKVRELTPSSPSSSESSIGNYLMGVQVNVFSCGGIALSMSVTHKIIDGHTYFLIVKAWAAAARGSPETDLPSFVASEVFPNNPSLNYSWPSKFTNTESITTKRFYFNSMAMASLKSQPVAYTGPSRMEATTALIWKAAAKASSTLRPCGPQSPHALLSYVNIRKRASPPLPYKSIGNLILTPIGICYPESGQPVDLPTLMGEIRASIEKINSNHIESLKSENNGHEAFDGILRRLNDLTNVTLEGDRCLFVTSLLNSGIYKVDFGWGKPIWFYDMNAGFSRFVALNDTLKGDGGVEATITLKSDEMEIFERDPELLSYAAVNPSPLQFLDNNLTSYI